MEVCSIVHVIGAQTGPVNVQVHPIRFMYVNAFDVVHVCAPFHPVLSRTGDHHEAAASYIHYTTENTRLQTHVLLPVLFLTHIEEVKRSRSQTGKGRYIHRQFIPSLFTRMDLFSTDRLSSL